MFDDLLVRLEQNECKDSSDMTETNNHTLADNDEYLRREPDHVFLRLSCNAVFTINNMHLFLLDLEEDKTCFQAIIYDGYNLLL